MIEPNADSPIPAEHSAAVGPQRGDILLLSYAVACALLMAGCVCVSREQFGTHRPLIHVTAVVLTAIYAALARWTRAGDPLQLLGLRWPARARRASEGSQESPSLAGRVSVVSRRADFLKWAWLFLLLGVASGAGRLVVYRWTGLGGVQLYEQQFAGFLTSASLGESLVRHAAFLVLVYLAVLLPGVFFFGVIQESFRRVGLLATGVLLQSLLFGLVHCYMTGSFNLVYGAEAFLGGLAFGIACHLLNNVYVPAVLLASNVFTATLLTAL